MSLVSSKDFCVLLKLDKFPLLGSELGKLTLSLTKLNKINKIYDRHKNKPIVPYLEALLNDFKIKYHISNSDLDKIPESGGFITISNHPLGGGDGILLLKLLLGKRTDFKVIANFLLQKQKPVKPYILPVNPFQDKKNVKSSLTGLLNSLNHIKNGGALGIFPSGEVSTFKEGNIYVDKPWDESAIKLIRKANVPVLPIYFHAQNSRLFYFLSKISPILRTLKLPSELYNNQNQVVHIKIGALIKSSEISKIDDLDILNNFLREKTYLLSKTFLRNKKLLKRYKKRLRKKTKEIVLAKNQFDICSEIQGLRDKKKRLFISNEYEVFFTQSSLIPLLMDEIGRLREITFRLIGEGTNKQCDRDLYDDYYHHLILWNNEDKRFVGAYRMGLGAEIFKRNGFKSFYVSNFFKFSKEMNEKLVSTIEMGRAFIVPDFQQKPMPLFLLWRGIAAITVKFPEYKYLMGGATISNLLSNYSKSMLMYFLDTYHSNNKIKPYIKSKKPYKVDLTYNEKLFMNNMIKGNVKKLDKLIKEVEADKLRLPVLIKQYIKQNAKFVAYNIDPNFNDAIDALIFMEISDIPKSTIEPILKDVFIEY